MKFLKIFSFLLIILILLCIYFFSGSFHQTEITYLKLNETSWLPTSDKLINFTLEYSIVNYCNNSVDNLLAVILVTSYLGNVELRSVMRRAFPQDTLQKLNITRFFLLGLAPDEKCVSQKAILDENNRFGDLIQGNFNEAYKNLTYKHLMGLSWATTHCSNVKFVIKMDDDIVINLYKIIDVLLRKNKYPEKLLAGYIMRGLRPKREPKNKWFVAEEEFGASVYPTFVSGWFYLTNIETCKRIVIEARTIPYFWVDDVFVTGILAQQIGIKHYNLGQYYTVHSEFLECCVRDMNLSSLDCEILIGPNGGDNNLFLKFAELTSRCFYGTCYTRKKSLNETCVTEKKIPLGRGNGAVVTYKLFK